MFVLSDRMIEKVIRTVDSTANPENVLHIMILNGVSEEERKLWTSRKKIFGWTTVFFFFLHQFFRDSLLLGLLYVLLLVLWSASTSFLNDSGLVVQDERGYTLYLFNKWQTKISSVYPLNMMEIQSTEPVDRIMEKRTAHLHLYVREAYYHVIVKKSIWGVKKQKSSFLVMMPKFAQMTYRKDLDFYYFGSDKYDVSP